MRYLEHAWLSWDKSRIYIFITQNLLIKQAYRLTKITQKITIHILRNKKLCSLGQKAVWWMLTPVWPKLHILLFINNYLVYGEMLLLNVVLYTKQLLLAIWTCLLKLWVLLNKHSIIFARDCSNPSLLLILPVNPANSRSLSTHAAIEVSTSMGR